MANHSTPVAPKAPPPVAKGAGVVAVLCALVGLVLAVIDATLGGRWTGILFPLALLGLTVTIGLVPRIPTWRQQPLVGVVGAVTTIGLGVAIGIVSWADDGVGRAGSMLMALGLMVGAGSIGWMALGLRRQQRRRPDEPESWVPGRW